ncbi:MAG: DUF2200 domain-containing protein [Lachnospiraceae bacterium]|nr:DUF2200 domain-containing protein [Lachnospiraceae bacterium]MDY5742675.1 DUF2200 domain-containing protein [Lachnospiraceae bacterium]
MNYERVYNMSVGQVFPLLYAKAERKGRSAAEVTAVIEWLTGYSEAEIQTCMAEEMSYRQFFAEAPAFHPRAELISGSVCGIKVQEISDPLMKQVRQLDKLVDELAKGKALEKVLR